MSFCWIKSCKSFPLTSNRIQPHYCELESVFEGGPSQLSKHMLFHSLLVLPYLSPIASFHFLKNTEQFPGSEFLPVLFALPGTLAMSSQCWFGCPSQLNIALSEKFPFNLCPLKNHHYCLPLYSIHVFTGLIAICSLLCWLWTPQGLD